MEPCSSRYTVAEGGTRLAALASSKNLLVAEYSGFISTRLVCEEAYNIRGLLSEGRRRSIHVTRKSRVPLVTYDLKIMTDLQVVGATEPSQVDWSQEMEVKEVLVGTSEVIKHVLEAEVLKMTDINVMILDSCHLIYKDDDLKYIMNLYKQCPEEKRPRILALTYPLFTSPKKKPTEVVKKDAEDTENNSETIDDQEVKDLEVEQKEVVKQKGSEVTQKELEVAQVSEVMQKESEVILKVSEVMEKELGVTQVSEVTQKVSEVMQKELEVMQKVSEVTEKVSEATQKESEVMQNELEVVKKEEFGVYENLDDYNMYEKLEWNICQLEESLCCEMDLAEDIDGGKRILSSFIKPRELIIEYGSHRSKEASCEDYTLLEKYMRDTVNEALEFLNDHRHDPTEIYGEELYDEFKNIPDPTTDPKNIFKQFLYVLDQLGPYGADKAAFTLLITLEKLKIKVPYERHFLLLCFSMTTFIKIRGYADLIFSKYDNDWEKIKLFSTAKVQRLAEILQKFHPNVDKNRDQNPKENTVRLLKELEKCDFNKLGDALEDKVNVMEGNLKEIHDYYIEERNISKGQKIEQETKSIDTIENCVGNNVNHEIIEHQCTERHGLKDPNTLNQEMEIGNLLIDTNDEESIQNNVANPIIGNHTEKQDQKDPKTLNLENENQLTDVNNQKIVNNGVNMKMAATEKSSKSIDVNDPKESNLEPHKFSRRTGRIRGRRIQRTNAARMQMTLLNPDALCGIVFVKEALMAKILFMMIVDMSRCHPKLSYLCAQYCAVEQSSDPLEPKECQRQGKKQEDVLKKFRMHECNLLLATPALEEGIDLPRCNLVLRWDIPPSYRSYLLCRGRARAPRSTAAVLSASDDGQTDKLLRNVAIYRELDQIITRKCGCGIQNEPPQAEEDHADTLNNIIKPYVPLLLKQKDIDNINSIKNKLDNINELKIENTVDKGKSVIDNELKVENNIETNDKTNVENATVENVDNDELVKEKELKIGGIDAKETENKLKVDQIIGNKDKLVTENELEVSPTDTRNNLDNENELETDLDTKDNLVVENGTIVGTNKNRGTENEATLDAIDKLTENIDNDRLVDENSKGSENNTQNLTEAVKNENLVCNKCTGVKQCASAECLCVNDTDVGTDVKPDVRYEVKNEADVVASVDLNNAIALINRYCGKLPSDTFTRLAPQCWTERVELPTDGGEARPAYICTLRLPLNCPVKYNIVGHPMPTVVLAKRMVALQACRILHKSGELDDNLMPIGKENFKAAELETGNTTDDEANDSARPGTTKRRQYYYKRTALAFTDCQPVIDTSDSEIDPPAGADKPERIPTPISEEKKGGKRNMLYCIVSKLWCALPERYNTRGRRLHAPQHAAQALGILMARERPTSLQIPSFPVYTRSGEVRVSVEHEPHADTRLTPRRGRLIRRFMRFVFSEVLRVRRRGMRLQSEGSTHNNYYIVPTIKTTNPDGTTKIDIDWAFLEVIYKHTEEKKHSEVESVLLWQEEDEGIGEEKCKTKEESRVKKMENPLLKPGETFVFDAEKYREAVVTPWYRNQDQPQFFLVAEICWNLTPDSAFPSALHTSFRNYYQSKYGVVLTQSDQPLLDVDHTSARLNLLTPRYVNRKGVALPVSSERTRRAKRDRLDQKQILVPELCQVHPFAAPLWFATVALPCVLYRINALLIADEIRRAVAIDVGLGVPKIDDDTIPGFQWPPLDFGWSLAEVLSADSEKNEKKKQEEQKEKEEKDKLQKEREDEQKMLEDTEVVEGKTINDILQEKEDAENEFEIGTWSNDMASSIPQPREYDDFMEPLPPNLTFCTSASGGANWCSPVEKPKSQYQPSRSYSVANSDYSYMSSDFDTEDSDMDLEGSDDETDSSSGFCSSKHSNAAMGVRIEYKTAHEAEAVDLERRVKVNPAPEPDDEDDILDRIEHASVIRAGVAPNVHLEKFRTSVTEHEKHIKKTGLIIHNQLITEILPESAQPKSIPTKESDETKVNSLFPYTKEKLEFENGQVTIESVEKNKRVLLEKLKKDLGGEARNMNCFSMKDVDIDSPDYVNEKIANVGFGTCKSQKSIGTDLTPYYLDGGGKSKEFDFDYQPVLEGHPGPSPSVILQALTMSNANDGINLERLETIGDSFLKFAITAYLYCAHPNVHEGKLSHMRSKQVSNLNLYRLGRNKRLGARMIAYKFEPHDNWLPPCHKPPPTLHPKADGDCQEQAGPKTDTCIDSSGCYIPYNLITQHSIPDKSIADCVEALIGAYLLECGPRGALLFMSWLGIRVLPLHHHPLPPDKTPPSGWEPPNKQKPSPIPSPKRQRHSSSSSECSSDDGQPSQECSEDERVEEWWWHERTVGSLPPRQDENGVWIQPVYGELKAPPSPLLRYIEDPEGELEQMLSGYESLESTLQYRFRDRSLLLQALTHASHHRNRLTDCYQRLEFLGDAILDYLITRHLYEDGRRHCPGALTDLRSALVNNTIFATLAAKHGFHKYFRHMSPGLNEVLTKYVKIQEENGHSISEEHYLIQEDEMEQAEDVEVPKALGDLFESVAGAIFLDSGMSLGAVWRSYVRLMGRELDAFSAAAPKSPVRELLEAEPDTAKFGKPERLADGRRVRVCVEVFGRGAFRGVGRNYRIAKGTAARCALRHLRTRARR